MARANFRLDLNEEGVKALLRSKDVQEAVDNVADKAAKQAKRNSKDPDAEFSASGFQGGDRYRAHVRAKNWAARKDERDNRSLSRLLGGGFL